MIVKRAFCLPILTAGNKTMKLFGIVSVTTDYPMSAEPTFKRNWVSTPSGIVMFDTMGEAENMANSMIEAAREEDIVDVSYRAREYDSEYI